MVFLYGSMVLSLTLLLWFVGGDAGEPGSGTAEFRLFHQDEAVVAANFPNALAPNVNAYAPVQQGVKAISAVATSVDPTTTSTTTSTTSTSTTSTSTTTGVELSAGGTAAAIAGACVTTLGQLPGSCPSLSSSPTSTSNWLIPGKLAIGEEPKADEAAALRAAGVDTFVSLLSNYTTEEYLSNEYPKGLHQADYVHFPIKDKHIPDEAPLARLIADLAVRLEAGKVVFIHCKLGHGRTGTVVIPLLAALYNTPKSSAAAYVNQCTKTTRSSDVARVSKGETVSLPETDAQWAMMDHVPVPPACTGA